MRLEIQQNIERNGGGYRNLNSALIPGSSLRLTRSRIALGERVVISLTAKDTSVTVNLLPTTMNTRTFVLLALALAIPAVTVAADWETIGNVTAVKPIANGLELTAERAAVRITALSPTVVRVRYARNGRFSNNSSFAVVKNPDLKPAKTQLRHTKDAVELNTGAMSVRVRRNPLVVSFLTPKGEVISQDDARRRVAWNGRQFRIWKSMPDNEHYFGLGDKAGPIDHRDQAFTNWTTDAFGWVGGSDPLYKAIPFFMATRQGRAYGVFLDNTYRSSFDFGKELRDAYSFGADGGELDYYFFYGPDPKKVVSDYTALTGRMPLPPLFALGYQQCRYSYYPEARVREIGNELRNRRIPADVIWLDIDYHDAYRAFTIDRKKFPNFEDMIADLNKQGFKTVVIVDLHTKKQPGYKIYDEGLAGDHFVRNPDGSIYVGPVWPGDSVFPDFTRAATREWYGRNYADLVKAGVRGFWNDMNEPAVFSYPSKTMPLDTVHRVEEPGAPPRKTDHREIHNVVGMQNVRATYDGVLKLAPNTRPFVLSRAGFAGTQRWAATWTGDNQSTWEHYRLTVPTLLSLGISGYAFVGNDVGGFEGNPTPELLTRWIQVGAFTPLYRNHTTTGSADQEPWVHGPEHEAIRREYIELRYKLMPYIYTQMEETSRTGVPLMRPMFMEFPADKEMEVTDKAFMFGNALMIAPKLNEFVGAYEVKFPSGEWFDYWTGSRVVRQKDKPFMVDPKLNEMPIYVRAGSIVAHQPVVQHTAEVPNGPLQLRVYPGANCAGSVYADDGETFDYTKGEVFRQRFTCEVSSNGLRVSVGAAEGAYKPWWTSMQVTAYGIDTAPANVTVNGKPITGWKHDAATKSVSLTVPRGKAEVSIQQ